MVATRPRCESITRVNLAFTRRKSIVQAFIFNRVIFSVGTKGRAGEKERAHSLPAVTSTRNCANFVRLVHRMRKIVRCLGKERTEAEGWYSLYLVGDDEFRQRSIS